MFRTKWVRKKLKTKKPSPCEYEKYDDDKGMAQKEKITSKARDSKREQSSAQIDVRVC